MSEIDYAGLRALAENATPGPWETMSPRPDGRNAVHRPGYGLFGEEVSTFLVVDTNPADAEFIAAMDPPTVIALLDEIERIRAVEADMEWEYVCDNDEYRRFVTDADTAEKYRDRGYAVRRRTKAVPAGPWVPVAERNPEPKGSES